jgi:nucleolar protein 56
MYLYSNILGTFVFSQNFEIREKVLFSDADAVKNSGLMAKGQMLDSEKKFLEKFKKIKNLRQEEDEKALEKINDVFSKMKHEFYEKNILVTRHQVKESVTNDMLIIQASSSVEELEKAINLLVKRLREWYSYSLPEMEAKIEDHEKFVELILSKSRNELVKDFNIKHGMGTDLSKNDSDAVIHLAKAMHELIKEKNSKEKYLEALMKKECPNITAVAGALIGAKLISIAGSLKNLILMPSSTVQLLGAEKALFRHMLNKNSRPPKYGILFQHQLIQKVDKSNRGKAARALSDKILLAAKVDYFRGKFIGDRLRKELEAKFE